MPPFQNRWEGRSRILEAKFMLWLISWPEAPRRAGQRARREQRTVLAPHPGAAFAWLVRQRPYVLSVASEVRIEPYRQLADQR